MTAKRKVSFLGLGLMGAPMARRLVTDSIELTVWNRSRDKAAAFEDLGAKIATTPLEAMFGAEIVFTMVTDGSAAIDIAQQLPPGFRARGGALYIDMSSASIGDGRQIQKRMQEHGFSCLDAPVSGGTLGASSGTLAIMIGGNDKEFNLARPVLDLMGRPTLVGPHLSGYLTKLANQLIVAASIASVSEAFYLLESNGADLTAAKTALSGGFADSRILQEHGQRIIERDFEPGGPAKLHLKDLKNLRNFIADNGAIAPMLGQMLGRFDRLCQELELGELDHSAIHLELLNLNGGARASQSPPDL